MSSGNRTSDASLASAAARDLGCPDRISSMACHPQALSRMGGSGLLRGTLIGGIGRKRRDGGHRLALAKRRRGDDEGSLGTRSCRPEPDGLGKNGSKHHLLVDARGVPLSLIVTVLTSTTASASKRRSAPSWSSARILRIGAASTCAPMRATAAPSASGPSMSMATFLMSLIVGSPLKHSELTGACPRRCTGVLSISLAKPFHLWAVMIWPALPCLSAAM